ncbi:MULTISPECIES: VOC family protein [Olivibacter]|jgi:predicted enzyme related to lactoylglutathione lyase|uniref:VOC family protein n=2 Tax=Olivibacter TaxID=376469 RepID=A0ABV6HN79_9SPHI|nr:MULTISPECIES: VOC family protein [Olivibacter]MCL4638215.1 VOC family protein [Olivibacter sp. UJ_SKK_5.1]MDM8173314.1 VOC family protein [Olivibacter sp. 47]QEL03092.1 VOC family protein [Olivibacter sp. LS-1]
MKNNVICWFEIYVRDLERAKTFYRTVLNRTFFDAECAPGEAPQEMKMTFFSSPDEETDKVSGALIEMPGTKEGDGACVNTIVYFPCQDCSIEESRVEAAGGKVHKSKFSIGEYGYCSLCMDTEGNLFGLYSME